MEEDPEAQRRATWLEVFADLVFAVAISQIATTLTRDTSVAGYLRFAGLFVPAAWAWAGFTFYANRFDTDDVAYRAMTCAAMLGIAALAVSVPYVARHQSTPFAISYVAVRAVLLAMYARARHYQAGVGRRVANAYLVGFSVGTGLWVVSIAVPAPARYALWACGLAIDLVIPVIAWRYFPGSAVNAPHLTERFGLFFIIVLGESVFGVVSGTTHVSFGVRASLLATLGFSLAVWLWWIYFDFADTSVIGRGRWGLVYIYGHFPLLAGVAVMGVGTELAIGGATHVALGPGTRWALCGGVAVYLLALSAFHATAEWTTLRDRVLIGRCATATGAIALAAAGGLITPLLLVALLSTILFGQLLVEASASAEGAASVWTPEQPPLANA